MATLAVPCRLLSFPRAGGCGTRSGHTLATSKGRQLSGQQLLQGPPEGVSWLGTMKLWKCQAAWEYLWPPATLQHHTRPLLPHLPGDVLQGGCVPRCLELSRSQAGQGLDLGAESELGSAAWGSALGVKLWAAWVQCLASRQFGRPAGQFLGSLELWGPVP